MGTLTDLIARAEEGGRRSVVAIATFVANKTVAHIVHRTNVEHLDVQGQPFADYKDRTAKIKGGVQPVTLFDERSGGPHLLDNVFVHREGSGVRLVTVRNVGEPSRRAVGLWHQLGTTRMDQRRWFGVTQGFVEHIVDASGTEFQRTMQSAFPDGPIRLFDKITVSI